MDKTNEETGADSRPLCNPDGGHRTSRLPSPPQPCSCHDHCNGTYGGEQCNARDADANASTAYYLDTSGQSNEYLCGDRMARDVDGDTDRDDGSDAHSANEHAHCCGDSGDCCDADCGAA